MPPAARFSRRVLIIIAVIASLPLAAHAQGLSNHQIWLIRPDGSEAKQITHDFNLRFRSPRISPDGQHIAADRGLSHRSLSDAHVVVMEIDGANLRDLGPGAMPCWSPEGSQLVFHVYGPTSGCIVTKIDGTQPRVVADHWGSPRWSPVGDKIISINTGRAFYVFDVATEKETPTKLPLDARPSPGFDLTAAGRRICFGDQGRGGLSIATFDDDWKIVRLKNLLKGRDCTFCSWSPDASRVVFSMRDDQQGRFALYLLDIEQGGKPVRIEGQPESLDNVDPAWSPDGQWIIFSSEPPSMDAEADD